MNIYTYSTTWFRHVIAAPSPLDARAYIIEHVRNGTGGIVPIVELLSPDVLTRRAADGATATIEIDRIPLFLVDVEGGLPRTVEYETLYTLTPEEHTALRAVSEIHAEWIDADDNPEKYTDHIERAADPTPAQIRAMAAAWGLGPPAPGLSPRTARASILVEINAQAWP